MKKLLLIFAMLFCLSSKAQVDIGTDVYYVGLYPTVKVTYPLWDRLIIGGSYGYNVTNKNFDHRIDGCIGWKFDEVLQIEVDAGIFTGKDPWETELDYVFHLDFGTKYNFWDNAYFTTQVSFPAFCELGIGFRLRPWRQLTVWDDIGFFPRAFQKKSDK